MTGSWFATRRRRIALAAMLTAVPMLAGGVLWACADTSCRPDWRPGVAGYGCAGQAMLNPGNDTRINMVWLMRSLGTAPSHPEGTPLAGADERQLGHTFLTWSGLRASLWPLPAATPPAGDSAPTAAACETFATAVPAFREALAGDAGVPASDKAALAQLRDKVGCGDVAWDGAAITSAAGRDYLAYLKAAQAFHTGDWAAAQAGFAPLTHARSRWIAETAAYMPIRIALRGAVASAVDKYGDFAGTEKVDAANVAHARDAIAAYLKAYPHGLYADSARGLMRRVLWLSGDTAALARSYETLLATTPGTSETAADLAEEIDNKLFEDPHADAVLGQMDKAPLLLAIADLKHMRRDERPEIALSQGSLDAQKAQFAAHADLFDLLQASNAFYAGDDPRKVLALLPDAAHAPAYTPLAFSRQMLRGMALAKVKDPNEAGFWQGMLAGASPLYQRPLVEMALTIRWQRDGRLDRVFAPASPITDTMTRELLLQTLATPAILRLSARDTTRPDHERDIARFTLLYKDLAYGAYADFGGDLALAPHGAPTKASLYDFTMQDDIPTALFSVGSWSDGSYPCAALSQTAATLARAPANRKAQLCLAEFYRLNGFDGFSLFTADPRQDMLGAGPNGFPGRALSRADLYDAIIADKAAAPDERAYALYRAVMCYAPSGYNGCVAAAATARERAAADIPKAQRKAWFMELHQRYPGSQWTQSLRYYW